MTGKHVDELLYVTPLERRNGDGDQVLLARERTTQRAKPVVAGDLFVTIRGDRQHRQSGEPVYQELEQRQGRIGSPALRSGFGLGVLAGEVLGGRRLEVAHVREVDPLRAGSVLEQGSGPPLYLV